MTIQGGFMEGVTVHKLNENLVVSLYELPGFKPLGTCTVRNKEGEWSGQVSVYYVGDFFTLPRTTEEFTKMHRAVMRLSQNYAIKTKIGIVTTRLNLARAVRPKERLNASLA